MRARDIRHRKSRDASQDEIVLPEGAPSWITPALVRETMATWQPYYRDSITVDDAVTMLSNVGQLFSVLSRG